MPAPKTDKFAGSQQESIAIVIALIDDDNARRIANLIEIGLFDQPFDDIVARCLEHRKKFGRPPGKGHIDDVFAHIFSDQNHKYYNLYNRIISKMIEQIGNIDTEYVLASTAGFIKDKRTQLHIASLIERFEKGGSDTYKDTQNLFRQGLKIGDEDKSDFGFTLADSRALDFLDRDSGEYCNIGIKELDERGVRPTKKEMLAFLSPPNRGKCVTADSMVLLANGQRKKIKDIVADRDSEVLAFNRETRQFEPAGISEYFDNGKQECYKISTMSGYSIVATKNHPFLTPQGWQNLEDLDKDDYIAVTTKIPELGSLEVPVERVRLLGYLISDGCFQKTSLSYTKTDSGVVNDVSMCVNAMEDKLVHSSTRNDLYRITGTQGNKNNTLSWIRNLGLGNAHSMDKFVPDFIFSLTDELIIEFLTGLLSGDSAFYTDRKNVIFQYTSASPKLVEGVRHLLIRLGITSTIKYFNAKLNGKKLPEYARLDIKRKEDIAALIDTIPLTRTNPKKLQRIQEVRELCSSGERGPRPRYFTKPFSSGTDFEKIREIIPAGVHHTYDITVPNHHNFIANDLIVHNSYFLTHCGKYALLKGWKVLHYTLENSEEMTAKRYFQSLFSGTNHEGKFFYSSFNTEGDSVQLESKQINPKFVIDDSQKTLVYLKAEQKSFKVKLENLWIRRFPSGRMSFEDLEQDLDDLAAIHRFRPDIVMVDMPQLMRLPRSGGRDDWSALNELVTNLRGLAVERDFALVVPQQGNRSSNAAKNVQAQHGSGSFGVFGIADNLITYSQTPSEESKGLARLFLQKVRNDRARITICISQHYDSGQFVMDSYVMSSDLAGKIKEFVGYKDGEDDTEDSEYDTPKRTKARS